VIFALGLSPATAQYPGFSSDASSASVSADDDSASALAVMRPVIAKVMRPMMLPMIAKVMRPMIRDATTAAIPISTRQKMRERP